MRKSPDVAVVTNVAPNHLDIHKDMDEYVEAKKNILLHQNAFSRTVLNRDNDITREFRKYVRGQSLSFSMERPLKNGAWLDTDGVIHMAYRGIDAPIMHRSEIAVLGDHNVENYLAAIAAVWGYVGVDTNKKVARELKGVEHRIQSVSEIHGDTSSTFPLNRWCRTLLIRLKSSTFAATQPKRLKNASVPTRLIRASPKL